MPKTIATASNVFAACDRLDAANERWNREDVRSEVGGGGWVVIDPLIKAWRALRSLREVAPSTPTELLQQVAVSLETHIAGFTQKTEDRLSENQKIFDATVSELAEKLTSVEAELDETQESLATSETANTVLTEQLKQAQTKLAESKTENTRLVAENDSLAGQVSRMEKEHKAATQSMQSEQRELLKLHAAERSRVAEEHASAIATQRKELALEAEQAENRLMLLLDQERLDAKANTKKLTTDLDKLSRKFQVAREAVVALEAEVKELTRQNDQFKTENAAHLEANAELQKSLETQKTRTLAVEREFSAYKEEHKLSGELGALQEAVTVLQEQLRDKSDKKEK